MEVRENILSAIGKTPLVRLAQLFRAAPFDVYAKCEGFNPGGSAKDRPALAMIAAGLSNGRIGPNTVIVESTSGNMGIGLAQACRYFGMRFICVVDPRTTIQNLDMLRAYGAEIDMVAEPDAATGEFLQARIRRVRELLDTVPCSFSPDQFSNPLNPRSHYESTIREILDALDGELDYLFCAVSTCGTIIGCAEFLRDIRHGAKVIAVDAVGSMIFGSERVKRVIPGLGAGIRPPLLDTSLIDECFHVTAGDCVVGCRRLVRHEAMLAGASAGGVIRAIEKTSHRISRGARCVAILPDRGERYLDTIYNDEWVRAHCADALELCDSDLNDTFSASPRRRVPASPTVAAV